MSPAPAVGSWSSFPLEPGSNRPALSDFDNDRWILNPESTTQVVGLGALCGLRSRADVGDGRSKSFWVGEFALLANGRRVLLHEDRGFTIGSSCADVRDNLRVDGITQDVLNTVLPDDAETSGEEHPWIWLAELAQDRGLDVRADDLRKLPYEVVLAESITRWLLPA